MTDNPKEPTPGRSTADAAFRAATQRVAERNEAIQKDARKLRNAREERELAEKRERDRR